MKKRIYTSESVTSGHPDKLADLIADNILDQCLILDKESRLACEVMLAHNKCYISGEITTKANIDYVSIAKKAIDQAGYSTEDLDFETQIHQQSRDIIDAVCKSNQGAGDQGIVYGYAIDETLNYMPLPIELAHRLTNRLERCRLKGIIDGLMPDGKAQVSIEYINDRFSRIVSVILSAQHHNDKDAETLKKELRENVINNVLKEYDLCLAEILINPSGRFVLGGFEADTGLTGRKLMVDTYGGLAHHGGGAMSGKDASKVDRSGAYLARYIAKNIVATGLCEKCEVALSYAIGMPKPTSIDIDTFNTGIISENIIIDAVFKVFDLSVSGTIEKLKLKQAMFSKTATEGHFGKEEFTWEQTDKTQELKEIIFL